MKKGFMQTVVAVALGVFAAGLISGAVGYVRSKIGK